MTRHRFDPVALVFGAVFVAAGLIVLSGGELIDEGRALLPVGLVALGVALLVHVSRRSRPTPGAAGPPAPAPRIDPHEVAATHAEPHGADPTHADLTDVDPTAEPRGVVPTADPDATEVVDPTERYPRS